MISRIQLGIRFERRPGATRRLRRAAGILALLFAVAPSLAIAAQGCGACCCPPAPCHASEAGCATELAATPCCDAAPIAAPLAVKSSFDPPDLQAIVPARSVAAPEAQGVRPPPHACALDARASPRRLSVVLRI